MKKLQNVHSPIRFQSLSTERRRVFLVLVIIGLLAAYPSGILAAENTGHNRRPYQLDNAPENIAAPDFTLPDLNGVSHRLLDYKGHVVIVNFWSTWCVPCRQEMPELEKAWKKLQPAGVVLLAIAMQDEPESVERFIQRVPLTFPILLDRVGAVAGEWHVIGIPATYILDTSGRIVYTASGIKEWNSDSIINAIIAVR